MKKYLAIVFLVLAVCASPKPAIPIKSAFMIEPVQKSSVEIILYDKETGNPLRLLFPINTNPPVLLGWSYHDLPVKECAWCSRKTKLERHHIIPQSVSPELRDVVTNLVVLCKDCHFVLGHKCSYHTYTPDLMTILSTHTNLLAVKTNSVPK